MEQTNNLTMYPTKGPIVQGLVNGRMMGVQLTASSNPEDAEKFYAMFEKQKLQKVKRPDKQEEQAPADKEGGTPAEEQEVPRGDSLEQMKKLAEQGYAVIQPVVSVVVSEGKFLGRGEHMVIREKENLFIDPGVAGLQPVAPPPLEVMSAGPVGAAQMQNVQTVMTDGVTEQANQALVQVEEIPVEEIPVGKDPVQEVPVQEIQTVSQQVVEEIRPQEQGGEELTVEYGEAEPEPVFHDVEAAPIKVGETAREDRTEETPDVERQLDSRLTQALEQGETRVELQLTPEHLGTVKVEITRTAEGTVRIALSAQSSETRSLLEKHTDGLRAALGGKTQGQVQVEVRRDEGSQRREDHPYEGHNGQNRQQQHRRQEQPRRTEDFLQQLRLGLILPEDEQE